MSGKHLLKIKGKDYHFFRLEVSRKLPYSIRILLENLLRHEDGKAVRREDIEALAAWDSKQTSNKEIAFIPGRVILQDFTGVPCVVDLAAMRDKIREMRGDAKKINPLEPVDLVIDHSVQVDAFGSPEAFRKNVELEFQRNKERYQFLRWGQQAFRNFRVVPPGTGIVHQVNLEYLAGVILTKKVGNETLLYPDTLVGTDSHTTMINGLGVLGWGVGGIEAEAAMLGQPISMLIPEVVGFRFTGKLQEGATATDLVLTVTEMLRKKGVVGKFVEFFGPGLDHLTLADRATIANMAPEYGATTGYFPVDVETMNYLRLSDRQAEHVELAEAYFKEQGLFRTPNSPEPVFSDTLELNLSQIEASLAGPKRPQDRVALKKVKQNFQETLKTIIKGKPLPETDPRRVNHWQAEGGSTKPLAAQLQKEPLEISEPVEIRTEDQSFKINHGSVVIAAITSCTNTSNPAVMMGAGLLAKKAVERGLNAKPWVKTSLAPGSKVVMDYLEKTGLKTYLEKLNFHLVGYGCTTCIGNSGPLLEEIGAAVKENDLYVAAVLSGNRNFEGRVNPLVRANYLASPPLVVAYALAGTVEKDLTTEPLGQDSKGNPVYLKDIWPTQKEIENAMREVDAAMFRRQYENVFDGEEAWRIMKVPTGDNFQWDEKSTYIKKPPYFEGMPQAPSALQDIKNARVLVRVGDSVTTDHISPAGSIAKDSPAAKYLMEQGVLPKDFNSYGARRGNHEVMMRGTFANTRLKNELAPGTEGGWTRYFNSPSPQPSPSGGKLGEGNISVYDAAVEYQKQATPLLVIAGKEYGSGSSRDWAAKGPALLGVKAVIAESFERIHRSNLIGMGILPLEFEQGQTRKSLGLTGEEIFSIEGIAKDLVPGKKLAVGARPEPGGENPTPPSKQFFVKCRIDTPVELEYYRHGGILQYVLRQLIAENK
ncbi:MAG: aconitate hydratase AcnA [Candidatus Omnitrophica bacterium]|nr:aconitate hydratase AcnA [Candidatus Omnitrophota bacterium]